MAGANYRMREIKPALAAYVREAQMLLKRSDMPGEKAVHDVRVLMKRSRAALRLVGPQLETEWFERNMEALRDTGRLLSEFRDTSVQRKLLKELRKEQPLLFEQLKANDRIAVMIKKPDHFTISADEVAELIVKAKTILQKTGYRIRFEPMSKLDARLLYLELENTYDDVVALYLECRNNPKPGKIHQFRKRAKDFLYQLYFFRPVNPPAVKSVEKRFELLSQNLGKYCDLKQLILDLGYKYSRGSQMSAIDELIVLIKSRQDKHLSRVWIDAKMIFRADSHLVNLLGFKLLLI